MISPTCVTAVVDVFLFCRVCGLDLSVGCFRILVSVNLRCFSFSETHVAFLSLSRSNTVQTFKRCRTEAISPSYDLQREVESQAEEIENLKSAKSDVESSFHGLKAEHEKTINENRILKRAVTIQQERQNQALSEIESARQYKVDAGEQIKKLEHIILSLRYHLQAQHTHPGNDFMGFPPRPPDVY